MERRRFLTRQKFKNVFLNWKVQRAWKRLFKALYRYYKKHPDEVRLALLRPMEDPQTVWKDFKETMEEERK